MTIKAFLVSASVFTLVNCSAHSADALTLTAATGLFTGTVEVKNEGKNTTLFVWQSPTTTKPTSGSDYVSTGFFLETDNNGNGSVSIPNISSGRLFDGRWVGLFGDQTDADTFKFGPAKVNGEPFTHNVPGPIPILGVGVAFRASRRLRQKIRQSKSLEAPAVV